MVGKMHYENDPIVFSFVLTIHCLSGCLSVPLIQGLKVMTEMEVFDELLLKGE